MLKGDSTVNNICLEVTHQCIEVMLIVLAHGDISSSTRLIVSALFNISLSWVGTERIDIFTPEPSVSSKITQKGLWL